MTIYYALLYFVSHMVLLYGEQLMTVTYNLYLPQKKVTRAMAFSKPRDHSSPLFSQLKLLKLYDIYKLYISSFIFECQNKTSPIYFSDFFTSVPSVHSYNTQSASQGNLFLIPKTHCNMDFALYHILV